VLITAVPTARISHPGAFISNRSTGKMGFASAAPPPMPARGVTLVSAPSVCRLPPRW